MNTEEKIILGVAFVGLVAVLLFQRKEPVAIPENPVTEVGMSLTDVTQTRGPQYLVYNAPWAYSPPINNFLPSITAGQIGQTINKPTNFDPSCGCYR